MVLSPPKIAPLSPSKQPELTSTITFVAQVQLWSLLYILGRIVAQACIKPSQTLLVCIPPWLTGKISTKALCLYQAQSYKFVWRPLIWLTIALVECTAYHTDSWGYDSHYSAPIEYKLTLQLQLSTRAEPAWWSATIEMRVGPGSMFAGRKWAPRFLWRI